MVAQGAFAAWVRALADAHSTTDEAWARRIADLSAAFLAAGAGDWGPGGAG